MHSKWYKNDQPNIQTIFSDFLLLFCFWILAGSIVYYLYSLTFIVKIIIGFLPLLYLLFKYLHFFPFIILSIKKINLKELILLLPPVLIYGLLFSILFKNRTTDFLISPWHSIEPIFFILYSLGIISIVWTINKINNLFFTFLLFGIHFLLTFSIAAIIYPLGFGFDAFIHRATETWININGYISPKQPYYIGQYSLVVILQTLTRLPLKLVDIYLIPVLASLLLPVSAWMALKKPTNKIKLNSILLLTFLPYIFFHLTTPHNLVILLALIIIFLYFSEEKRFQVPIIFLSLAALLTHPLLGAPIFIFALLTTVLNNTENKKIRLITYICSFISFVFVLPVLFSILEYLNTQTLPSFNNPFTKISDIVSLFHRPYWYAESSPIIFELLYSWQWFLTPLFVFIASFGYAKISKSKTPLVLTALALVISGALIRTWFVFHNVVAYEQGDYPLRLFKSSLLFIFPLFLIGCISLYELAQKNIKLKYFSQFTVLTLSIILMLNLYLAYPQKNPKARFPGYNVTQADFEAVQYIHNKNSEFNYIVLANQLVSAAALNEYSFARDFETLRGKLFYYSIPTGGPLYEYYGKMIYEGQKREYMEEAMNLTGVKKSYFVVNKYWANSDRIIKGALKTADYSQEIENGNIWIFEYIQK